MEIISNFRSLEQFGIIPLTGESDTLGYRILCDLNHDGIEVIKACFGLVNDNSFARPWNRHGIASIMLSEEMIRPVAVMGFYLQGKTVVVTDTVICGLEDYNSIELDASGEFYNYSSRGRTIRWPSSYGVIQNIIRPQQNKQTRNVHQATSRTV